VKYFNHVLCESENSSTYSQCMLYYFILHNKFKNMFSKHNLKGFIVLSKAFKLKCWF